MSREPLPLQQLCSTAICAAREAGQFIQNVDRSALQKQFKEAGSSAASQVVTEVDIHSEAIIRKHLQQSCDQWDIAFVGEESSHIASGDIAERLSKPHFWCVDPLDGTLPFVEGNSGYAVSIALVERSGVPLIGVVYDPVDSTLVHAIKGKGAYRNESLMCPGSSASASLMVFADASFAGHENYNGIVQRLSDCARDSGLEGVQLVYGSGAVKNACQVLDYAAACHVKLPKLEAGGGSIWDFAATACIVQEAGGWVSNFCGQPLGLNGEESTFMNRQGVVYASSEALGRCVVGARVMP